MNIVEECQKEIRELRKIGVKVSAKAYKDTKTMEECSDMSVSDIVDLLIVLH